MRKPFMLVALLGALIALPAAEAAAHTLPKALAADVVRGGVESFVDAPDTDGYDYDWYGCSRVSLHRVDCDFTVYLDDALDGVEDTSYADPETGQYICDMTMRARYRNPWSTRVATRILDDSECYAP